MPFKEQCSVLRQKRQILTSAPRRAEQRKRIHTVEKWTTAGGVALSWFTGGQRSAPAGGGWVLALFWTIDGGAHRFQLITGDADVITAAERLFTFRACVCPCVHLRSTHLILCVTMDTEAAGLKLSPAVTLHMLTDRGKRSIITGGSAMAESRLYNTVLRLV